MCLQTKTFAHGQSLASHTFKYS